ncbi:MAG: C-terminal binding protein [Moorea sp. SIO2I5]|nr:C-terminal binding protein [Moorena sp. SIO2I5]
MKSNFRVAIIDSQQGDYLQEPDIEQKVLQPEATVVVYRAAQAKELIGRIEDVDAIISWHKTPLDADILGRLQCCRGIVRAAVGFDNIDLAFAAKKGIPVCNVPDYGTEEVADHTLGLILALVRKLFIVDSYVRNQGWDWRAVGSVPRLRGMTLGIIGFGRIGSAVARRAHAFGLKVAFYDPYVPRGTAKAHGVTRCETLNELIDAAQIITLHTALTSETQHLIGREELKRMTPETILINTARGQVIDQEALIESIISGSIGQVGLDVLSTEPNVPDELRTSEKVILTGHSAFYADAASAELRFKAATFARMFLFGQEVPTIVNGVSSKNDFQQQITTI